MTVYYSEVLDGNNESKQIQVMKRSGERVPFDKSKIVKAIHGANNEEGIVANRLTEDEINQIAEGIMQNAKHAGRDLSVEEIQDMVEDAIMHSGKTSVARRYITYRYRHNESRKMSTLDQKVFSIIGGTNEEVKQENSNKNPTILSVQRDYMAGELSRHLMRDYVLPKDIAEAHDSGMIHLHDMDYIAQSMYNCCIWNLEDMLQNGTNISGTHIDKPKSFITACTVTSQLVAQIASAQFGGQTWTLAHLAPFVDVSRQKIRKRLKENLENVGVEISEEKLNEMVETDVRREVEAGCQTLQYQLITLQSTNGQAAFVTVSMYLNEIPEGQTKDDLALLIEVMLNQRIKGVKDTSGAYITPAFPKLIYVLQEDNINPDGKYYYLTELAAKCTAKRMVPDYVSEKIMLELKGDVYPPMGCRSFLTPDRFTDNGIGNISKCKNYIPGKHKYYGRFNCGVVTLNLPDVALSSGKDEEKFWEILNERMELCHKALQLRHKRLRGVKSDVAPILWQDGAIARLEPGETIDELLFNGYSTISLGYAGLAECVYYMKEVSHTSEEGKKFGLAVMQALNDACNKWKAEENIDYSAYGTPLESLTYKFAKTNQQKFGIIPGVTDKNYLTNSYHVKVTEEIDAFDKISKEAEFQKLSPGGAISYVEVPDMQNNIPAIIALLKHMYNTILYSELNTKSDHCDECGFDGEIEVYTDETGMLGWKCPQCGCTDQTKMHVARRTCGLTE